jgi:glycosyltransferase involved in cell wall biosynthesis
VKLARAYDVLVASADPPDPFGNAAGRWYYVLAKSLADRGHRVRWLASYPDDVSAERARTALQHTNVQLKLYPCRSRSWLRQKAGTARRPYSYFISDEFARDMREERRRGYDILHLEQTPAGWLGLGAPRTLLSVLWLASVDLAHASTLSFRANLSRLTMTHLERRFLRRFDNLHVLTTEDAAIIRALNPAADVFIAPLGIDPTLYRFDPCDVTEPVVGLIGSMGWMPGYQAALRLLAIWPRIKASVPRAHLLIAGWGATRLEKKSEARPDVTILGDVADAEAFFRRLAVMVFPAGQSSGMKVKVLEAMAYGVPVVTTPQGLAGIDAVDGVHASVEDDDDGLVRRVVGLLHDRPLRRDMRCAARRLVQEKYSPEPILDQVEAIYQRVRTC